jgi:osomolarity two-component system sensor histidine kinase SLN1
MRTIQEFNALSGSLTVMSKGAFTLNSPSCFLTHSVLNDVLDLNRMDAGKFESVAKPYSFHKVLDSLMVPLRMAAAAKQLQLIEDLDPVRTSYPEQLSDHL